MEKQHLPETTSQQLVAMETLERFTNIYKAWKIIKNTLPISKTKCHQPTGDHNSNIKLGNGRGTKDQRIILRIINVMLYLFPSLRILSPCRDRALMEQLAKEQALAGMLGAEGGGLYLEVGKCRRGLFSLMSLNRAKGDTTVFRGSSHST